MKYYFNWIDLKLKTNNQINDILLLTYATTIGYNKTIANYTNEILYKLKIDKIDYKVFNRYFKNINNNIINQYKVTLPQSYFINKEFLTWGCTPRQKVEYLYLLSLRNNSAENPSIPIRYVVNNSLLKNPLTTVEGDNLIFIPELNELRSYRGENNK
jgi:hypothetical protein